MALTIALLRAVNVGGRTLAMADLRTMLETVGFADVRTLLQSGNVVFEAGALAGGALEAKLEAETAHRMGLATDYLVRSSKAWAAIIAANPFPAMAVNNPGHLMVVALKRAPSDAAVAALQAAIKGREQLRAAGRELYIAYPDGIGQSRFTLALIERRLGVRGTGRNWNTVLKLAALVGT